MRTGPTPNDTPPTPSLTSNCSWGGLWVEPQGSNWEGRRRGQRHTHPPQPREPLLVGWTVGGMTTTTTIGGPSRMPVCEGFFFNYLNSSYTPLSTPRRGVCFCNYLIFNTIAPPPLCVGGGIFSSSWFDLHPRAEREDVVNLKNEILNTLDKGWSYESECHK